jgi:hypothetical protein
MEGHDLSLADVLRPLDRLGALLGAVTDLSPRLRLKLLFLSHRLRCH